MGGGTITGAETEAEEGGGRRAEGRSRRARYQPRPARITASRHSTTISGRDGPLAGLAGAGLAPGGPNSATRLWPLSATQACPVKVTARPCGNCRSWRARDGLGESPNSV